MSAERLRRRIEEWFTMPIEGHGLWCRYEDAREMLGEVLTLLAAPEGDTEPERCPECGGRIKGFTANAIRQCTHEWHFTPAGLTDREYRALYRLVRAGEGEGLATAQTHIRESPSPAPSECPTCGSTERDVLELIYPGYGCTRWSRDPWHGGAVR